MEFRDGLGAPQSAEFHLTELSSRIIKEGVKGKKLKLSLCLLVKHDTMKTY
jgi:hypothetical protein